MEQNEESKGFLGEGVSFEDSLFFVDALKQSGAVIVGESEPSSFDFVFGDKLFNVYLTYKGEYKKEQAA